MRKRWKLRALAVEQTGGMIMRASILATLVVFGSAVVVPAIAQQQPGPQQSAPSEQAKPSSPEQMQQEADKGIKTRNSGESGYVADQEKPGASTHPPGQPESSKTTGSTTSTGTKKAPD
jgi:hypothetical protein